MPGNGRGVTDRHNVNRSGGVANTPVRLFRCYECGEAGPIKSACRKL